MIGGLGFLLEAAALAGGVALVSSVVAAGCSSFLSRLLSRLPAARRADQALVVAALPAIAVLSVVGAAVAPSLLAALGLFADHCGDHLHHAHLCPLHPEAPRPALAALGAAVAGLLLFRGMALAIRLATAGARLRQLERLGKPGIEQGLLVVEVPGAPRLCVSAGVLRRRIVYSAELRRELGAEALGAALAHEAAHLRRFDPLARLLLSVAGLCTLPGLAELLERRFAMAAEEACDEEAAAAVGDPATVAGALVAAARLQLTPADAALTAFGGGAIERRVHALLSLTVPSRRKALGLLAAGGLALAVLTVSGLLVEPIHHGAETLLHLLN